MIPECWDTVRAFTAVETQWRYAEGRCIGLDYSGCCAAVRALRIKWKKVFAGLRIMEQETLDAQK